MVQVPRPSLRTQSWSRTSLSQTRDFDEITDCISRLIFVESAGPISTFIWVVIFGVNSSVLNDPCKSILHQTTVASSINIITINEVLFTERNQLTRRFCESSFHGSRCAECPA